MKILYLSYIDISLPIGPSVNEREFILSLNKMKGVEASFVIPKPKDYISDELPKNITFLPSAKIQQIPKWIKQQYQSISVVKKILKDQNIDFMIIRSGIFPFAIKKIAIDTKIPYALKTAGSGKFNIFKSKNIFIKALFPINQNVFKEVVKKAFAIDVVSTIHKDSLEEITGVKNKIYFIDNGVNTNRFFIRNRTEVRKELGLSKFKQIIGYVGGSPWERGGLQIIESIPLLQKRFPDIGGVIVGGGSKMELLYRRAKELDVEEKVVFVGVVPFEEVNDYINAFDIGISQLYPESQGASEQKVRQYLACGKPVIVSPGAVNNFIEEQDFGFIVQDPYSILEFTKRVVDVFDMISREPDLYSRIRQYAEMNLSVSAKVKERLIIYKNQLKIK